MNILGTQFTLQYNSLDIYIAGCKGNPHCHNCHNPESWDFNKGELWNDEYFTRIEEKVSTFNTLIKNVMIFGGEPLDQNHNELELFLKEIHSFNKQIWIFTRYGLDDIPTFVKENCDYIKSGRYIEELTIDNHIQYGIKLATSNQHIYKKGIDY
jgi:anaerobic ribonucleoside-triphosphate reductase activating protein